MDSQNISGVNPVRAVVLRRFHGTCMTVCCGDCVPSWPVPEGTEAPAAQGHGPAVLGAVVHTAQHTRGHRQSVWVARLPALSAEPHGIRHDPACLDEQGGFTFSCCGGRWEMGKVAVFVCFWENSFHVCVGADNRVSLFFSVNEKLFCTLSWGGWVIIITIKFIYHALINALSAHMIHINLNTIYTHRASTQTIYIRYMDTYTGAHAHTHTHTHTCTQCP